LREQITAWEARLKTSDQTELAQAAEQARDKLLEAENELVESRSRGAADSFNYPPKVNSKLASLQSTVAYGDAHPPQQCYDVFKQLSEHADERLANLRATVEREVTQLNERIQQAGVAAIG
jgi:hypothetical protein